MRKLNSVILYFFCFAFLFIFLLSCRGKDVDSHTVIKTYPQNFKSDVAWIVSEWNGKPAGYGSGLLVDKEHGAFYTNKHVSDMFNSYGKGSHKIFFNGKIYNAEVVKVPALRDAALVRISDNFDSSEFPEPASFSAGKIVKGQTVILEGFHPHPQSIIDSNKNEGYDEILVPIWDKHYNLGTSNYDKSIEMVYEKIAGKVISVDAVAPLGVEDIVDLARELSNTYVMVRTLKDHKFSFGGLSGTIVRNTTGEIVGMVTIEKENFEPDTEEMNRSQDGNQYVKKVFNIIGFTPIASVANLKDYLIK